MTAASHSDLATIEQLHDATALHQFLYEGAPMAAPLFADLPAAERRTMLHRPTSQLRKTVSDAATIAYRAGLNHTTITGLSPAEQHQLARGQIALLELATRERHALDSLQAAPPAYLVAAIGRAPQPAVDTAATDAWRRVAARVQAYRLQYAITDPTRALGPAPTELTQRADWSATVQEIAWSPSGLTTPTTDPRELGVFDTAGPDVHHAFDLLRDPAWRHILLSRRSRQRLHSAPNPALRSQVTQALDLLNQRPPDRSAELDQLQATRRTLATLVGELPELDRWDPREEQHRRLAERLRRMDATLVRLQQAQQHRYDWDRIHHPVMARAWAAASILAHREIEALLALCADPPDYLTGELGHPPTDRAARLPWCRATRSIERYRTRHDIADPHQALGPQPTEPAARAHHTQIRQQLEGIKQELSGIELGKHAELSLGETAPEAIGPG